MRIYDGSEYRDATSEEEAECKAFEEELNKIDPSAEEILAILLGGEET